MPIELFDPVAAHYDHWYETEIGLATDQVERAQAAKLFQPSGVKVLEIGCGTGQYTAWLAEQGYQVTAVDISEKMMERAQEKIAVSGYQISWLLADITQIIDQLGLFQGIFSMTAFEFIPNPNKVLAALFSHLAPGGCLTIGMIAGGSAWSDFYEQVAWNDSRFIFAHAHFYTENEIRNWQVGVKPEIGTTLYFPPQVQTAQQALDFEEQKQKRGNPGFLMAKWVKA